MEGSKLPLGICRQALMKLDGFMSDIREIMEDEEVSQEDKEQFEQIHEVSGDMAAIITNMVSREMEEEEFLNEHIDPDAIEPHPSEGSGDILDEEI